MLSPNERRLYSDCFQVPENYVFDAAVGTTFSLDLESFLFAQFCIATGGEGEPESVLRNPVSLLEAIHRVSDRVSLFCHEGETNVPNPPSTLYGLLEECIQPARGRGGGALFHPKVWVIRFKEKESDRRLLRVVVLSRNLTTSRAWDSFLCFEAVPEKRRPKSSKGLAELLRALPGLCRRPSLSEARAQQVESLAQDVENCVFMAPYPFEGEAHFIPCGIRPGAGFVPDVEGTRMLAVSPFVSPDTLDVLTELAPGPKASRILISRPEEMAKCGAAAIEKWDAWSVNEAANADADSADPEVDTITVDAAPSGLHAKILAVEEGGAWTTWWFGSGNLTRPVRSGASVELMVQMRGRTKDIGIEHFLEAGFRSLLEEYTYKEPPEDPQVGNRSAVNKAALALTDANLSLRCEEAGKRWNLLLSGTVDIPEKVTVTARPVSLPAHHATQLTSGVVDISFRELTVEALGALVAFRISAGEGEANFSQEMSLKLPIANLPTERDSQITRSIIKNRAAFLNYLRCILALAGETWRNDKTLERTGDGHGEASAIFGSGLLERLMRTLHREPERLSGLHNLVEDRSSVAEGEESPIPEDFLLIWKQIAPIVKARTERMEGER